MLKVLKYSVYDLLRSKWMYVYFAFYLLLALTFFWLSGDTSGATLSLMNVVLVLVPLVSVVFGVTYYYSSKEFIELLLAQPLRRRDIFSGLYLGLATSLSTCLVLGLGIPLVVYGLGSPAGQSDYLVLMAAGLLLTFVFSGLALWIGLSNDNRIRGFGLAVFVWLLFAIIYDGIFLLLLSIYSDYPLETFALTASMLNPIDLCRILITLQLDIAALMGYTGAVFQKTIGTTSGMLLTWGMLLVWVCFPVLMMLRKAVRKDF